MKPTDQQIALLSVIAAYADSMWEICHMLKWLTIKRQVTLLKMIHLFAKKKKTHCFFSSKSTNCQCVHKNLGKKKEKTSIKGVIEIYVMKKLLKTQLN